MLEINENSERPAASSLLLILGVVLIGFVIANIIGVVAMFLIGGISFNNIGDINGALISSKNGWWGMMVAQGISSFVTFIAAGWFYWSVIEKKSLKDLSSNNSPGIAIFILVALIQLIFSPFNGYIQELNQNMQLPTSLSGLEEFMKSMEDSLKGVTEFLTNFQSPMQLILALLVIAVFAGIGEELIFRGLIQRKIQLATQNPHLAIWMAAFIFSAIHFQFYGFFPRLFLGAMFGYFYYWTGNIWVPIFAHIFNNGLAVFMIFLVNKKVISPEIEKMDNVPPSLAIASLLLFCGSMWYFRSLAKEK